MIFIRSCIFYLGYYSATLLFGLFSPAFLLPLLRKKEFPKKIMQRIVLSWVDFVLLWLRWCCGVRVTITGNLSPLNGPAVIVSNHQSNWETFFLQKYFSPVSTILKKELLNIPLFGWGLRVLEPIAIDRGNPVQALQRVKTDGIACLQQGRNLLVFPEGTRKPAGELGEYKRSAVDIARQAGVPVIPVVHNSGECWPGKKFIKLPGRVHVIIGNPVETKNKDTKKLVREIRQWTQQQLNQIHTDNP